MRDAQSDAPTELRVEHRLDALGIGERAPRLSWREMGAEPAERFELEVSSESETWTATTTGCVLEEWPAPPLRSRDIRTVRVRAIRSSGPSDWSAPLAVEAGLLEPEDWSGRFIRGAASASGAPVLRQMVRIDAPAQRARLYVVWRGVGEIRVNGAVLGEDVLSPGWYSYAHRDLAWTHDVTDLLVSGDNTIELRLGDGWYAGRVGFFQQRGLYGDAPAVLAQLEIADVHGAQTRIATDSTWASAPGPVLRSDIYDGEVHDARHELPALTRDELATWARAVETDVPGDRIAPALLPPSRRHETLAPVSIGTAPSGETVVDFGQNLVGRARIHVDLPAGTTLRLRHAEVLEHGELAVAELRSAQATDWYTSDGSPSVWEPAFTFHGFRYLGITGWSGPIDPDAVCAVVIHSRMRRIGEFRTSHPGLDRLHENVVWSTRGNFLSLPTDCPQRDERLGWTGDIAVFAPTAAYLFDVTALLQSWLTDVVLEQTVEGSIPHFVPFVPFPANAPDSPLFKNSPTAVWGDAAVLVPWALYEATGDTAILSAQYTSMRRWVEFVDERVGPSRIWEGDFQYGDWLDPTAPADDAANGATDPALVATAYFANSARLLGETARILGEGADAVRFASLAADIRAAFRTRFLRPDGRLSSDSQTAYAIALSLGLLESPDSERSAGRRLVELVRATGHRIGTGFVGTPIILDALSQVGAVDDAYGLVLQTELPSWLYAVEHGATTIWERWDSLLPDGSVNPSGMTSFNHYALGSVASWLHGTVGGLSSLAPGWTRLRIAPRPHRDVRSAATSHETPYGRAAVEWSVDDGVLRVRATVPPRTSAVVDLPGLDALIVGEGRHDFEVTWHE
ncbi:glycoside hydrolase family 78 protein [Microbacterium sp. JZ70]